MSKHCFNCGRVLDDNQNCDCSVQRESYINHNSDSFMNNSDSFVHNNTNSFVELDDSYSTFNTKKYQDPRGTKEFMLIMGIAFIEFFKSPKRQLEVLSESRNIYIAMFFLSIQGFLMALFSAVSMPNMISYSKYKFRFYESSQIDILRKIDYKFGDGFLVFIQSLITYIILIAVFTGIIYLLKKSSEHFVSLITAFGVASIPLTVSFAISIILLMVSYKIAFIAVFLIILSVILSLSVSYEHFKKNLLLSNASENYIICLLNGVFYFIVLNIIIKIM